MAAVDTLIQILQGNKVGLRNSKDLELLFKALGIGTSNIQIKESATAGVLEIVARVKVADAVNADEAGSKGQLDTATTNLQNQIDSNDTELADHESRLSSAETSVADHETRITAAEGTISTHTSQIGDHEIRLSDAESTIATHTTDIATNAAGIAQNVSDIAIHETRLDDAEADIDALESSLASIEGNNPDEEEFTAIAAQVLFNLTQFQVDADNAVRDVELFIDGRRQPQSTDGTFSGNKAWRKNSTTQIELATPPGPDKVITVWKQGTAVVISGGGGTDLTNIVVDPRPAVHGDKSLGTILKAWKSVLVKDKTTAQTWEIEVDNGVLQAVDVTPP